MFLQDDSKVLCTTTTGRLIFTCNDSLVTPRGLIADDQGNLLVCSRDSNNVYVIKSDGSIKKPLLSHTHQIQMPCSIAFRSTDGTLVIGEYIYCSKVRLQILKLHLPLIAAALDKD